MKDETRRETAKTARMRWFPGGARAIRSLAARLYLLVFIAAAPALIALIYNAYQLHSSRMQQAEEYARTLADLAADELDQMLNTARSLLVALAQTDEIRERDVDKCTTLLRRVAVRNPDLVAFTFSDPGGATVCSSLDSAQGQSFADRDYFKDIVQGSEFAIGAMVVGRTTGLRALPVARQVRGEDGTLLGLLVTGLVVDRLAVRFAGKQFAAGTAISVLDRGGVFVVRLPNAELVGSRLPQRLEWLMTAEAEGTFYASENETSDGVARVIAYKPLRGRPEGLIVAVGVSTEVAFAGVRDATISSAVLIGLGISMALLAAWAGARFYFVRPVEDLARSASRWARGDYAARAAQDSRIGELDRLAETFNTMAGAVQSREGERDRAMRELRTSERRLSLVADAMPVLMSYVDRDIRYRFNNRRYEEWFGISRADIHGRHMREILGDAAYEKLSPYIERALDGHWVQYEADVPYRHGGRRVIYAQYVPDIAPGGQVEGFYVFVEDITERKRSEDRQKLLLDELNHRVRNSLATVLSLAQQTARSADSVASFNQAFQARVMALAGAHSLLTKQNWEGASLRGIVEATLAPHGDANSGRVRAAGPDCDLSAAQALAMSLGLHELATNARKYGALSTEAGTVSIEWSISDDSKGPELLLRWSEKGGPPVHPPTRRGFGTRLLTTALGSDLGGSVSIDFAPGGVTCSMRFPLGADARARPRLPESSIAN